MTDAREALIAKAEAVVSLWDLVLFSSGQAPARIKRADVMQEAVANLRAALVAAKGDTP